MESLRWIMIAENAKRHPAFHEFIKFIVKGDNLKLLINSVSKNKLKLYYSKAKKVNKLTPTYNQASIDRGILDFEVVKYLLKSE